MNDNGVTKIFWAIAYCADGLCSSGRTREMKWADIDFDRAEWKYEAAKTKFDHLVPLSRQVVEILRDMEPLTGHGVYVFAGAVFSRPISKTTINWASRAMGYSTKTEIAGHGFLAMARTMLSIWHPTPLVFFTFPVTIL